MANNTGHYKEKIGDWERIHRNNVISSAYNLTLLDKMSVSEIYKRLNYFTFMVVRNPLDRVLSAYNDKFVHSNSTYYRRTHGRKIIKQFHKNATKHQLVTGEGVSFSAYVQYINKKKNKDHHWTNIQSVCYPCINRIDYVINLEASSLDNEFIIRKKLSGYSANAPGLSNKIGIGAMVEKSLPKYNLLTSEVYNNLLQNIQTDLSMFGYSVQNSSGTIKSKCGSSENGSICCC